MRNKLNINQAEYSVILRQAVSEIRVARALIAKQVNASANSVLLEFGQIAF